MSNDPSVDAGNPDSSRQGEAAGDWQAFAGGLELLAEELGPGRIQKALGQLADQLNAGLSLGDARDALGDHLPDHLQGMIQACLFSGRPHELLEQFAHHERIRAEQRRMMFGALAYPLLVLGLLILMTVAMLVWIVPVFADMYQGFELDLPWAVSSAVWISEHALYPAGLLLIVVLPGLLILRMIVGRWIVDWLCASLPLVGPVWRFDALADFVRRIGMLVEFGVPLPEALRLAAGAVDNEPLAGASRAAAGDVADGRQLSEALATRPIFVPSLVHLVRWGERAGSLPEALQTAGRMYEQRAELQGDLAKVVLPPVLLLLSGLIIGFFFWGLMQPLIEMVQSLT